MLSFVIKLVLEMCSKQKFFVFGVRDQFSNEISIQMPVTPLGFNPLLSNFIIFINLLIFNWYQRNPTGGYRQNFLLKWFLRKRVEHHA